jgi:hypothetical protein
MIQISANQRFLRQSNGEPFFYLADTAWELFHRLTYDQASYYLADRATKGFTVIQAVVLAELDGLRVPTPQGDVPFESLTTLTPNARYFAHVDAVIAKANQLGLVVALLPTWGDKWNQKWGTGPEIFTVENAYTYGHWLGQRYRDANIIWVLGGDRPIETTAQLAIIESMAAGLRAGDEGRHLCTFHPQGQQHSSQYFGQAEWIDFHMLQSGHARNRDNWRSIADDYALIPTKPCMDGEPGYEDHPAGFAVENGYLDDYDARKACYWALFAGAHGHTYGCHPIWQFWSIGHKPLTWARRPWQEALQLPGASQMQYAKHLLLSRPYFRRIPDQSLIAAGQGEGTHHIQACRDSAGSYAMIYLPANNTVEIDVSSLLGPTYRMWWFNPRTGHAQWIDERTTALPIEIATPFGGPDWVLVIDSLPAGFEWQAPGRQA